MFKDLGSKLFFIFLIFSGSIIQAADSNFNYPTSFVGPTGKAKYTHLLTQNSAFSVLAEAGPRNYRLGGTLGWRIEDNQLFKISAEYLRQDIVYSFFNGDSREWAQQGAIGAHYQYDLCQLQYMPQFNLRAGYSHAPSKQLNSLTNLFINGLGLPVSSVFDRRIAGSNAGYVSPGLSIQPWHSGRVGVELNYDDVHYDRIYSFRKRAQGFGGSANWVQQVGANTEVGLNVGIRQPFNAYQANVFYTLPNHPSWSLGLDGNYVNGKLFLPNTYNVGISINYLMQEEQCHPKELEKEPPIGPVNLEVSSWTADPAIYLPQVLAITDESVTTPTACSGPTLGTIPSITTSSQVDFTVPISQYTSGTPPITYTVSFTGVVPPGTTVTIDPSTGLLSIHLVNTGTNYSLTVTVNAQNACGIASTSFGVDANFD